MKRIYDAEVVQEIFDNFPTWLRNGLRQFTEAWITAHPTTEGVYVLSHPDHFDLQFNSVYETYEAATERGLAVAFGKELFVNGIVHTIMHDEDDYTPESAYDDHLVSTTLLNTLGVPYAMFNRTFASWVYSLQEDFEYFNENREKYLKNPTDFEAAYNFVQEHPMSWVRHPSHQEYSLWMPHDDNLLEPYFEDDDGNKGEFWVLETGEHVEPDYTRRYFDPKLSVWSASSPSEAYIQVAAKIEKTLYPDGTRKGSTKTMWDKR